MVATSFDSRLLQAQNQAVHGDQAGALQSRQLSIGLSIAGIITGVILYILWIIAAAAS